MQIIIDIDKKVYNYIMATGSINMLDTQAVANAIFDGETIDEIEKQVRKEARCSQSKMETLGLLKAVDIIKKNIDI